MSNLNTPQRIFLAIAGVAILIFQLYKFSEYGIEGSGWVIALVAAAVLILPGLSLLPNLHNGKLIGRINVRSAEASKSASNVQILVQRAVEKAQTLNRRLPFMIDLPPLQGPEFRQMNLMMTDSWLQYCLAYTGCLSLMTEWKRDARFPKKPEYAAVWAAIVDEMVLADAATAKRHGLDDLYSPASSKQWATRDMNEAELAMRKFVDRLAAKLPEPDAPFIGYLVAKLSVPESLVPPFVNSVRRFTKDTLREFSGM